MKGTPEIAEAPATAGTSTRPLATAEAVSTAGTSENSSKPAAAAGTPAKQERNSKQKAIRNRRTVIAEELEQLIYDKSVCLIAD